VGEVRFDDARNGFLCVELARDALAFEVGNRPDRRIGAHVHRDAVRDERAGIAHRRLRALALVFAGAGRIEGAVERVRQVEVRGAGFDLIEAGARLRLHHGARRLSAVLFRLAGLSLYTEQYLAALIAIATPLVFLHVAADGTKGRDRVPWYDLAAAAAAFAAAAYLAWRFPRLSELVSRQPWDGLLAASTLLLVFLEGLRRTSGMALFITTLVFIALALFGGELPGEFAAPSI